MKLHNYQGSIISMSIDSSTLSSSKISVKKTPFYKHEDPNKLNYYARFSPKRKMFNEEFLQDIQEGSSPLSPRTSRTSSASKSSSKSSRKKVFKDQPNQTQKIKFELIDPQLLISVNDTHQNRGQIYIDEDENSSQEELQHQNVKNIQNGLISNDLQEPRFYHPKNILDLPIYELQKESSESQESSSFQRMIEQSSSQDNDVPYILTSRTSGGQMLIEDNEDSEPQTQKSLKRFKVQSPMKILDGSEQKILQLAKCIGAYNQNETEKKQVKSESKSFSIDSDLSQMEQKWNSYFESDHLQNNHQNQLQDRQFFSENALENRKELQQQNFGQQQNKIQSQSEEQLPSFSHPDTSSYYITPLQSQRQSVCSEDLCNMIDFEGNHQTKEFKRQFTFGNQLNAAYQGNISQNQLKIESKQPMFKKFLQKSTIDNFKNRNLKKNPKQKNPSISSKSSTVNKKSTQIIFSEKKIVKKQLVSNEKNKKIITQIKPNIFELPKVSQKKEEKEFSQENQQVTILSNTGNEILIIQEQVQNEELKMTSEQVPFKTIVSDKQKGQNDLISKSQKMQKIKQNIDGQIKIDDPSLKEESIYENDHQQYVFQKANKNIESNSYSKIFSEKKFHRIRKGSYNDRVKISQSQYQSSQEDQSSQKDNKFSQPKSQGGESITTTTERVNQNPHYFSKNRSNCFEQVENLKKYLQRIQNSPLSGKQAISKIETFEFNENFQSDKNQNDQKSQSFQNSYSEQISENVNKKIETEPQYTNQKVEISTDILPFSYQQKATQKGFHEQQNQTPIKFLQKMSEIKKQHQTQINQIHSNHVTFQNFRSFQKSLAMLQNEIEHAPQELSRIFEKIYTQVYQQELKYQQNFQKQQLLMNLMRNFVEGQIQKIDCENYLLQQLFERNHIQTKQKNSQTQKDEEDTQIMINKHIILALVRNLAKS